MIHKSKQFTFSEKRGGSSKDFFNKKKSLGQNFLKSEKALLKMCESGDLSDKDVVLEIGPGMGVLTEKLLERGASVISVEKDDRLIEILQEKFTEEIKNRRINLIHDDILDFSLPKNIKKYKLIANIPYNITGAILKKFLEEEEQPTKMVLLVQKEVAERIIAKDGKESILSISIKAYGQPKYLMTVARGSFSPAPKVDSAIIEISDINKNNFTKRGTEKMFFEIVKAGFSHKRKMLIGNLSNIFGQTDTIKTIFNKLGINPTTRAEDLTLKDWLNIERNLQESGVLINK
ncbi:MAG: ribosomal RNA small subunit methyltransferase A [Candidatus Moranbacteria bacterium]|nr:ribosomal RNA small subunit methyltransferase A [Candidatus Moranbacteria bacterium]